MKKNNNNSKHISKKKVVPILFAFIDLFEIVKIEESYSHISFTAHISIGYIRREK